MWVGGGSEMGMCGLEVGLRCGGGLEVGVGDMGLKWG